MVLALIILIVAGAPVGIYLARVLRRHRTPSELRGDWWTSFEREFRAYAQHTTQAPRHRRHQPGARGSSGR